MTDAYDRAVDLVSGETVNGGSYLCRRCGHRLKIENGKVTNLPVCPQCQSQHWTQRS